ncbi:MAG: NAD-glutamate dehydrogenase [Rhodospirillaceae bacterium]|nr:NAD-glutamate dehydrogenase [Rhodospirillaceae bacterium]
MFGVYRGAGDGPAAIDIKLYRRGGPMRLSSLIPTLENLGLSVIQEAGYQARPAGGDPIWIHDFHTEENPAARSTSRR